jgi:hypothetical protein
MAPTSFALSSPVVFPHETDASSMRGVSLLNVDDLKVIFSVIFLQSISTLKFNEILTELLLSSSAVRK